LIVPGAIKNLPSVNRSKFSEKEVFDEQHWELVFPVRLSYFKRTYKFLRVLLKYE